MNAGNTRRAVDALLALMVKEPLLNAGIRRERDAYPFEPAHLQQLSVKRVARLYRQK